MNYRKVLKYSVLVLGIFVCRYAFSVLVNYTLPYREWVDGRFVLRESKSIRGFLPSYDLASLLGRWDTPSYVNIAEKGYDPGPFTIIEYRNWAFFPLYPLLMKGLAFVFGLVNGGVAGVSQYLLAGLVISNVCFILALYYFDELLETLNFTRLQKNLATLLFLTFPAGYFFSLIYGESLFLLLSCLFLYLVFRNKVKLSALVLGLLLVSRSNGLTFLPLFFMWFWVSRTYFMRLSDAIISLVLVFLPLSAFLLYMHSLTGDFLAPIKIQSAWNNSYMLFGVFITYVNIYGFSFKYEFILSILMLCGVFALLVMALVKYKSVVLIENRQQFFALLINAILFFLLVSGVTNITSLFRYMGACVSLFAIIPALLDPVKYRYVYGFMLGSGLFLQSLFFVYFLTNSHVYGF